MAAEADDSEEKEPRDSGRALNSASIGIPALGNVRLERAPKSDTAPLGCENPDGAVKNSVAMRASTAGSGSPAGTESPSQLFTGTPNFTSPLTGGFVSLVLMISTNFDVFEHRNGVVC